MSLYLETLGHGDDVVLIHGWGIHGAVWQRTAERLAERYCVHIVDLPGCGDSAMLQPYTLESLADALDAAFPLPVHVIGWSLGGAVGAQWALRRPDQLRSLTLCASSPCFMQRADWLHATPPDTLAAFAHSLADDYAATIDMFLGLQVMGSRDGRSVLRALKDALASRPAPGPAALMAGLDLLREADLRGEVPAIGCPVLLQYGDRDRMTPPEAGRWLAAATGGELVLHAGAGHAPFISHEDAFVAAQRAFLDRL
ncbi:pimeloyl-ACP methyl ester esterase BioH [Chitinimonas koreensis]|uniref:pimeloyl-ACP methyl ester esterase BioH n=1 Tax=Chitinimonas koreensis TaxID=356302 RepID=UPI0004198452|nr:pimeloyl-ACP methyl ester esterase BioH [Chitinimonas koreensis]QNM97253.1 pimeloyl-ACP methyl ester esterase BioH [Chitinimonas koreensis]